MTRNAGYYTQQLSPTRRSAYADVQYNSRSLESITGLFGYSFLQRLLNLWAVKALGDGPVYSVYMALYMYLMLKRHLAQLALETIPFFDGGQVLPLKVLRQVAGYVEFIGKVFYFGIIWWQR